MKKIILNLTVCLLAQAGLTFGALMIQPIDPGTGTVDPAAVDPNSHINLYAGGSTTLTALTVNPGAAFSLDTYIQFTGYTAVGLSYWLEASTALAPHLTLTSETYFQNWNGIQPGTNNGFANATGVDSGYLRESRDLGSTSSYDQDTMMFTDGKAAGTYQISTLNFSLDGSTPVGTYTIQLTTLSPVVSEISEQGTGDQFIDHAVAVSTFTLTVVPEPATLSLLGLGALGSLGLTLLRARRNR